VKSTEDWMSREQSPQGQKKQMLSASDYSYLKLEYLTQEMLDLVNYMTLPAMLACCPSTTPL